MARTATADFAKIANKTRVHHHLVDWVTGTVIQHGNTKWLMVKWDLVGQSAGTAAGTITAEHVANLVVVARPRPVIEFEARTADETRKAALRDEWRLAAA